MLYIITNSNPSKEQKNKKNHLPGLSNMLNPVNGRFWPIWGFGKQGSWTARNLRPYVVYKATVKYEDKTQHYIGMTENSFKTRYTLHKSSFKHSKNRKQTELSNLIWSLTDKGTAYNLTWQIIDQARPYLSGKRTCNLCLSEKFHILTGSNLINRKTELLNKCPHRRNFLARNHKPR